MRGAGLGHGGQGRHGGPHRRRALREAQRQWWVLAMRARFFGAVHEVAESQRALDRYTYGSTSTRCIEMIAFFKQISKKLLDLSWKTSADMSTSPENMH